MWKSTRIGDGVNIELTVLERDGTPEIVALSRTRLVVIRKVDAGPSTWLELAAVQTTGTDLAVCDCDGDGAPEFYVLDGQSVRRFDAALVPQGSFTTRAPARSIFVENLGFSRSNPVLAIGPEPLLCLCRPE